VPMSRGRRVGIVGIASPPSTAGTRGKTNLSRMARFAGKDRGASDSFSHRENRKRLARMRQGVRLLRKRISGRWRWTEKVLLHGHCPTIGKWSEKPRATIVDGDFSAV
jgi:hypothetical protein